MFVKRMGREGHIEFLATCDTQAYEQALEQGGLVSGELHTVEFVEVMETNREAARGVEVNDGLIADALAWFRIDDMEPYLQDVCAPYLELALGMVATQEETHELLVCLQRLLESRDWAKRAAQA